MPGPKPKKKVVRVVQKRIPGEIVQKRTPPTVDMGVVRPPYDPSTAKYIPTDVQTGDRRYGPEGRGTNKEMRTLLQNARDKGREVTEPNSKGLRFRAGQKLFESQPPTFPTSIKFTPEIRKVDFKRTPVYERTSGERKPGDSSGKLIQRAVTMGGTSKGDHPSTKFGTGSYRGVKIRKVRRGRVPNSR